MAERRMASITIMTSDKLLQLNPKSVLLYQYLMYYADDDGLIGNSHSVLNIVKAKAAQMQELIQSGFLLRFDSGVIAITHWLVHNQIRKDRYKPSLYLQERNSIFVSQAGIYNLEGCGTALCDRMKPGKPNGNQMATQDSIGKDSIGQDSSGKDSIGKDSLGQDRQDRAEPAVSSCQSSENVFIESVLGLYHKHCAKLKPCHVLTEKCKAQILGLQAHYSLDSLENIFRLAGQNSFLSGGGANGWVADLSWLTQRENLQKVQADAYASFKKPPTANRDIMRPSGQLGQAELEAIQKLLRDEV